MSYHRTFKRLDALWVGGTHVVIALYLWAGRGVTIVHDFGAPPWDWFWQNAPTDLLRDRALESLWWMHAQPPLWNALGAVLIKLFGSSNLAALQALNIALGSAIAVMVLGLVREHTGRRGWGLAAGFLVAVQPSLFLFEAYALYTVWVAFLIVLAARLLSRGARSDSGWWPLVGFVATLSALMLTRSLYHVVIFAAALPLIVSARGRPPRLPAVTIAVLLLLPLAWYGKNLVQYGFFGGSSWYGMGLWRTALFKQDSDLLARALRDGRLDPVVRVAPFSPPSAYGQFGYQRGSRIPLLGRDDMHNVNIPAISDAYQRSAKALILAAPSRYAANVLLGYGNFATPSSLFRHLTPNRERMGFLGNLDQWLLLRPLFERIEGRIGDGRYYGSLYYFLIPAVLLTYLFQATRGLQASGGLRARIKADAAPLFLASIVLYTVAVGCTMELGENVRFKFLVEPAFLALTFIVLYRLIGTPFPPTTDAPAASHE